MSLRSRSSEVGFYKLLCILHDVDEASLLRVSRDKHADGLLDRFGSRRFDSHGAQRLAAASIASYSCRDELSSLAGL